MQKVVDTVDQLGGWQPMPEPPKVKKKYSGIGGKMSITDDELRALMKKKFATLLTLCSS